MFDTGNHLVNSSFEGAFGFFVAGSKVPLGINGACCDKESGKDCGVVDNAFHGSSFCLVGFVGGLLPNIIIHSNCFSVLS